MTAPLYDDAPAAPDVPVRRRPTVRRVPPFQPPCDDEVPDGVVIVLSPRQEELPFDEPPPRRFEHDIDFFDRQPTRRRDLPDPEAWATRFLQAVLETLSGARPPVQLQEWTSSTVRGQIVRVANGGRWARPAGGLPAIRAVRVGEPADGVAEICGVVRRGRHYAAIAARLEGFDGRWRCVSLQLG